MPTNSSIGTSEYGAGKVHSRTITKAGIVIIPTSTSTPIIMPAKGPLSTSVNASVAKPDNTVQAHTAQEITGSTNWIAQGI